MSDGSQKRKAHEMDARSEDNSDFKVVAASLIQKKKSGPTSVKQRYVQERLQHNTWWPFLFLLPHVRQPSCRKLLRDYAALLVGLQSPIK